MEPYLNAALLRFDGDAGANAPTKSQVALTWGLLGVIAMKLLS